MLQSLISLLPTATEIDENSHHNSRNRGKNRHKKTQRDDLGKWIWIHMPETPGNFYLYARKSFQLTSKPTEAILKATAGSRYKLYVNGQYVGKGPVRSDNERSYFDTYDITDFLTKGKNVIAFHIHYVGENTYSYVNGLPGLICKADIQLAKKSESIVSDESWKVIHAEDWTDQGERICSELGFQEVYNAANLIDGWNNVKFNDRRWENAVIVGTAPSKPWGMLEDRDIPPLHEEKLFPKEIVGTFNSPERGRDTTPSQVVDIMAESELKPLRAGSMNDSDALLSMDGITFIKTPRGDRGVVAILDFGKEVFGNVEIGIANSGTGCIDIGYAEILEDGHVKPNRGELKYTDRLILKKGKLDWQSFEPRAFRYLQIEFRWCSKQVALEYVRVNQTTYPVRHTGSFECSDELLNKIWSVGAYTTELCMEDAFISCPWRERAQWWADARIESRVAYYAFDDVKLLAQGLRQIASTQNDDGSIVGIYPVSGQKMLSDYALFWIFSILDYYAFADDAGLLRELYPSVKRLLEWFAKYSGEDMLLNNVPGEPFIDWADVDKRGEITALNCLYHQALRVTGIIASILGSDEEAEEFINAASKLKIAINKYLYSSQHGLYADCRVDGKLVDKFTRQTNILATLCDVSDQYQKATAYRILLDGDLPEIETPYFDSLLLEALYAGEKHNEALDIIRRRWGWMIDKGATTFWEFYHKYGTLCHGWSAGPARDLLAEYVGIKPVLGSHRFTVAPHPADLKWAKGTINTKTGLLNVDWKIYRGTLTINVEVPVGLKVDVQAPGGPDSIVKLDGKSHTSRFITLGAGKHQVRITQNKLSKFEISDMVQTPSPMKHVEILDDVPQRGRRQHSQASTKRRARSKDRNAKKTTVELVNETEIISEVTPETQPATEVIEQKPKKRTRRGGRRRGGKEKVAAIESVETVTEQAIASDAAAETVKVTEETADIPEVTEKRPRRRSRRGGKKRSEKASTIAEETPTAAEPVSVTPAEPEVQVTPEEPVTEQPAAESTEKKSRKRTRRGGRRKHKSDIQSAEASNTEEAAVVETRLPEPSETVIEAQSKQDESETTAEAPKKSRRRSHRGGRRRSNGNKPAPEASDGPDTQITSETAVESTAVPVNAIPAVTSEEPGEDAPKKKAYRRPRRRRSHKPKETTGDNGSETPSTVE